MFCNACIKEDRGIITDFYSYPNPANSVSHTVTYRVVFNSSQINEYRWKLEIFTENGHLVYESENLVTAVSSPLLIQWAIRDNDGNRVRNGIYTAVFTLEVTKTASGYAGSTYQASCKTVIY